MKISSCFFSKTHELMFMSSAKNVFAKIIVYFILILGEKHEHNLMDIRSWFWSKNIDVISWLFWKKSQTLFHGFFAKNYEHYFMVYLKKL